MVSLPEFRFANRVCAAAMLRIHSQRAVLLPALEPGEMPAPVHFVRMPSLHTAEQRGPWCGSDCWHCVWRICGARGLRVHLPSPPAAGDRAAKLCARHVRARRGRQLCAAAAPVRRAARLPRRWPVCPAPAAIRDLCTRLRAAGAGSDFSAAGRGAAALQ